MELFEKMDPTEREIMILEAVQGSVAIEGMEKAVEEAKLERTYQSLKANQKMETCAKVIASNEILRKFVKLYDRCSKIDSQGDKARSYQFKLRRSLDTKARMCP